MPCNSGPSYVDYSKVDKWRFEEVTRVACELAKLVKDVMRRSNNPPRQNLSKETRRWITRHEKIDRERIAAKKEKKKLRLLRKKALNKLSPREKKALGLTKKG